MSIEIGFELEFGCDATDSEIENLHRHRPLIRRRHI